MAAIIKFFIASLVALSILNGALAQYTFSNITVHQQKITGSQIREVTVTNNCICGQSSVVLACKGFQSTNGPDPNIFRRIDGTSDCSLNNEQPVFQDDPIKFNYTWHETFNLRPVSSTIICS